jgi:hypothetical protein
MIPSNAQTHSLDPGRRTVHTLLRSRYALGILVLALAFAGGCSSCEQAPEAPMPVPQEGKLPKEPELAVTPAASITPPPPACAIVASAEPEEGIASLEVHFSAEGMCTDGPGTFTWDFGDNSAASQEQNPVHTYNAPGTYTAHVTLADPEHDCKDTDEVAITVAKE